MLERRADAAPSDELHGLLARLGDASYTAGALRRDRGADRARSRR